MRAYYDAGTVEVAFDFGDVDNLEDFIESIKEEAIDEYLDENMDEIKREAVEEYLEENPINFDFKSDFVFWPNKNEAKEYVMSLPDAEKVIQFIKENF